MNKVKTLIVSLCLLTVGAAYANSHEVDCEEEASQVENSSQTPTPSQRISKARSLEAGYARK